MRIFAVVAAVFFVSPAFADVVADAPARPVKEKKICKTAQDLSGTRLGSVKRDCRTKAEWDADRTAQQRDIEKMSRGN